MKTNSYTKFKYLANHTILNIVHFIIYSEH